VSLLIVSMVKMNARSRAAGDDSCYWVMAERVCGDMRI